MPEPSAPTAAKPRLRARLWPSPLAGSSLRAGVLAALLFCGCLLLALVPGRWATARHQTQYGYPFLEFFIAGLCRDAGRLVEILGAVVLGAGALAAALGARLRRVPLAVGALAVPLVGFASSAFAEFKIQRGLHPTVLDLKAGLGDPGFVTSALRTVFLARHLVPMLGVLALMGLLLAVAWRCRSQSAVAALPYLAGWVLGCLPGYLVPMAVIDPSLRLFSLGDRRITGAPFETFFVALGDAPEHVKLGVMGVVERAHVSVEKYPGGEALLGLPPRTAARSDCRHPAFARSFWFDGGERALGRPELRPPPPLAQPLLDALRELSVEIFRDRSREPLEVWQVLLESFRADDIHALNPAAPREIAPAIDALYAAAAAGRGDVMASRHTWEAGQRTSEALSATICGLGTLPYALSFSRDFGPLPLRCWWDVLEDAGFEPSFYYGARTSFDNMDEFLRYHGVRHIVAEWQLPVGLPRTWGVTDLAVFDHALAAAAAAPPDRARYHYLLSISNHTPFLLPADLPASVTERVDRALGTTPNDAQRDDRPRLLLFSYTDEALGQLVARLSASPQAGRSLVVIAADHSVADHYLWQRRDLDGMEASKAQIPLVVWLPPPFVARSSNPERVRELVRRVQAQLDATVLSQNDIPMLMLTLLSASHEIAGVPAPWRWHELGGQATSPWFRFLPRPAVRVYGVNGVHELFYRTADDRAERAATPSDHIQRPEDVWTLDTELLPVTALLSAFLGDYGRPCRDRAQLRR